MDHQAQQLSDLQAASAQQSNIEFCLVCGDRASGRHYGAISCEGCKGFFKRSIRKQLGYQCRGTMCCEVTKHHRNRCQYCRLQKCLACGMRSDSVQHERKPIVDRKGDENIEAPANTIIKCRSGSIKKDAGDPLNYLNLFQLHPFSFMNQASAAQQPHYGDGADSPPPQQPQPNIKLEGDSDSNQATLQPPPQLDTNGHQELLERCRLQEALDLVGRLESAVQTVDTDESNMDFQIHHQHLFDVIRNEQAAHFKIQLPNLLPNMFYVCEVGSRLLFKTIDWLKDVPLFADFSLAAQCSLLQASWCDLFILGLAQTVAAAQQPVTNAQFSLKSMIVLPLVNFLRTLILQQGGQTQNALKSSATNSPVPPATAPTSTPEIRRLLHHLVLLHNFVDSIVALRPDDVEFAHLKLISLFNAQKVGVGGIKTPTRQMISQIQLGVSRSLRQYIGGDSESSVERSQALLHTLPVLCSFERSTVEYMFFNNLIGHIQMEHVIPYILGLNNRNHEHDLEELSQRALGDDK